jgi:hypothetical protein
MLAPPGRLAAPEVCHLRVTSADHSALAKQVANEDPRRALGKAIQRKRIRQRNVILPALWTEAKDVIPDRNSQEETKNGFR